MSFATSPDVHVPNLVEDSELLTAGLPLLYVPCATITITSKHVLKKAAKQLGVLIHGYSFTPLGEDVTASVTMDVPPHAGNPLVKRREFYGEWTKFTNEAKESACSAALSYLKDAGLIEVHDTNFAAMNKYKRKFEAEHFLSSILCDRADILKKQLSGGANIPAGISSHTSGESTPFNSITASSTRPSTESTEGPRAKRQARRALFVEK